MTPLNINEARANLHKLIEDTSVRHEPVIITGTRSMKPCTSYRCQGCTKTSIGWSTRP